MGYVSSSKRLLTCSATSASSLGVLSPPLSLTTQSLLRWPRFARRLSSSGSRCWLKVLARGASNGRAESLATVIVCALEGGLILARTRRDTAPLDAIAEELASMVQSALPRWTPA